LEPRLKGVDCAKLLERIIMDESTENYRIVNDGGRYMITHPWHVEGTSGYGWGRMAVCETLADAEAHVKALQSPYCQEDLLGLGCTTN
jgi:hypothetical protein